MMAQKRSVLMFLVVINSMTLLNCMEEKGKAIDVMKIAKQSFEKGDLEDCPFFPHFEVMNDLRERLKNIPGINEYGHTLISSLPEDEIILLIKGTTGLFTVKKNSPESSSPVRNNPIVSSKNTDNNQKKSRIRSRMSQSSDAIMHMIPDSDDGDSDDIFDMEL